MGAVMGQWIAKARQWLRVRWSLLKLWIAKARQWRSDFLGPRRPGRFRWRIWLRVRWLLLKLWWREDVSLKNMLMVLRRPFSVLLVGLGVPWLTLWLTGNLDLIGNVVDRANATTKTAMDWREFVQLLLLFVALPAAFILWSFRDHHVNATLENQRKDVNLKAFQEIQLRATGALDSKLPDASRDTLQIAALHQLRAFLRGEFGENFRRPAFELLLSIQQNSGERLGLRSVLEQIAPLASNAAQQGQSGSLSNRVRSAIVTLRNRRSIVELAAAAVISSEWRAIWRSGFPLDGRKMDLISVPGAAILSELRLVGAHLGGANLSRAHLEAANLLGAHLEGADLRWAHLEGANLRRAHLEGANLSWAHLEAADLRWVHLEGANLLGAHLEGANLRCAHLEGANLRRAHLEGANLRDAHLEGADLRDAHLEGADLSWADFDDDTQLGGNWNRLPAVRKRAAQQRLRDLGAHHVNDPEQDDEESEDDEDAVP